LLDSLSAVVTDKKKQPAAASDTPNSPDALTIYDYKRRASRYLHKLYRPYFLAVNALAHIEKALGMHPCQLVRSVFPADECEFLVDDAVKQITSEYFDAVFGEMLPKATWLPSLNAFAKLVETRKTF